MSARPSRDSWYVLQQADPNYRRAVDSELMQASLKARHGKVVTLQSGREAVEFVNCSYLGLDMRPDVIEGAKRVVEQWGVHFCCARSRFTIEPNTELEAGLSELFRGPSITFPSVTSAHMSALPLVASGVLLGKQKRAVRLIFDRYAHASMQYLIPILRTEARVETIPHNDLEALRTQARAARAAGELPVYVADGVYSMGGVCPLSEVLALAAEEGMFLYLDDAHGTSVYGDHGEGYVLSQLKGRVPENLMLTWSLAKGFGCNGGGITVGSVEQERLIRTYGQTYAFSGPLDFAIVGAAQVALGLHRDGTVARLQQTLRANVRLLDGALGLRGEPFSPIRMVQLGSEESAIAAAEALLDAGYFTSVAFFPVVGRGNAQLRICITVEHTAEQILGLTGALAALTSAAA